MKVYLSPSDQWKNIVADKEHSEAKHCTEIANACKVYLENNGISVIVGNNSKEKSYPSRVKESNNWGADLHVAIHTNAGGGKGTEVLCWHSSKDNAYVKSIYEEVSNLTPTKDRGIKVNDNLYEISNTNCVTVYIEVEFHDNKDCENWIDANIDNISKAIARGICKAKGIKFDESETELTSLYKVQIGAFKNKANAEKLANELKSKGYSTYITRG